MDNKNIPAAPKPDGQMQSLTAAAPPPFPLGDERRPCSGCGTSNVANAKFCKNCGISLHPPDASPSGERVPEKSASCHACSAENASSARFCRHCGVKLIARQTQPREDSDAPALPSDPRGSSAEAVTTEIVVAPIPLGVPLGNEPPQEVDAPVLQSQVELQSAVAAETPPIPQVVQSSSDRGTIEQPAVPPPTPKAPGLPLEPADGGLPRTDCVKSEVASAEASPSSSKRIGKPVVWTSVGVVVIVALGSLYAYYSPRGLPASSVDKTAHTGIEPHSRPSNPVAVDSNPSMKESESQSNVLSPAAEGTALAPADPSSEVPVSLQADPSPGAPFPKVKSGKQVYATVCKACHDSGTSGSPRISDPIAWKSRIARGKAYLYASAINGKGAMPARGGVPGLRNEEVMAAVDFVVAQVARAERSSRPTPRHEGAESPRTATTSSSTEVKPATEATSTTGEIWLMPMRKELEECLKAGFLQQVLCKERVRWKYCAPDRWDKFPECAVQNAESSNPKN